MFTTETNLDIDTDDEADGDYMPTPSEVRKATAAIRQRWKKDDARRIRGPFMVNDQARNIERDPVTWLDFRIGEIETAIGRRDFRHALAIVDIVRQHGVDYEPPRRFHRDSYLAEIFDDATLISHLEKKKITRARHILALTPNQLRTVTPHWVQIIEVMRRHFGPGATVHTDRPLPTSGCVDWSMPSHRYPVDPFADQPRRRRAVSG
jgi:hypothetical protein